MQSVEESPSASLLLPVHRPVPQHVSKPKSLRLASIEDRLDDVGRKAGEREELADVRDSNALRKVGN